MENSSNNKKSDIYKYIAKESETESNYSENTQNIIIYSNYFVIASIYMLVIPATIALIYYFNDLNLKIGIIWMLFFMLTGFLIQIFAFLAIVKEGVRGE